MLTCLRRRRADRTDVYFHTVLFPAMLIGDGRPWTMLHNISSTRKLASPEDCQQLIIRIPQLRRHQIQQESECRVSYTAPDRLWKLTSSVFGNNARETGQPASVWRYYLISQRPETNDSAFLWSNFIAANNNELLANLGNFCNRVS